MSADALQEQMDRFAQQVVAAKVEDVNTLARATAERNRVAQIESERQEARVILADGAVWLNQPQVRRIVGDALERPEMRNAPLPRRQVGVHAGCVRADALAALLRTRVLGHNRADALRIVRADTLDDMAVPDWRSPPSREDILEHRWGGRMFRHAMEERFTLARGEVGRLAGDQLCKKRGIVPDWALPYLWATKSGDPFQGPVRTLADALPLEVGVHRPVERDVLLWVRRIEAPVEEAQASA